MDSLLAKGEPQPAVAQWADLVRLRSAPYYDGVADIDQLADAAEEAGLSDESVRDYREWARCESRAHHRYLKFAEYIGEPAENFDWSFVATT